MEELRWGVLAPGKIAHTFVTGLQGLPGAKLAAVGSRSLDRAKEFALQHGAPRAYGSYEDLARDEEVDVIYVSNPHNYHKEATILCLENGRAVLCEKPFAVSAAEAQQMVDAPAATRSSSWRRCGPVSCRPGSRSAAGSTTGSSETFAS